MKNTRLPPELQAAWEEIEAYAREYGLDFFPIIYEVLDYRTLYETAALGGFPIRYPHWRFGMEYDQLMKGHIWLGSTIYEMVINTNPAYAYLLEGNDMVTQKMVMAHVAAHVDFFKNNMWFAHTNRKMLDEMANHAARVQRLIDRYGYETVEEFIDICLSLENLIDYHAPYIKRPEAQTHQSVTAEEEPLVVEGLPVERSYMRDYINPPEFLEQQRKRLEEERARQKKFPEHPQKDVLLFLMNYAPLERWQHSILEIVRDEAYYFAPQGMTKILNEGWACCRYDTLVFTDQGVLRLGDIVARRQAVRVSDGETPQAVYDWASFENYETIKIRTRRGLELEGSINHRVMLPNGDWRRLDELQVGDRVRVSGGQNLWAQQYVAIDWLPVRRMMLAPITDDAEVEIETAIRSQRSVRGVHAPTLAPLVAAHDAAIADYGSTWRQTPIRAPEVVDERLAAFLGYLCSNGHISAVKHTIGLTTADEDQAHAFANLVRSLFGIEARWHRDGKRWGVSFSSRDAHDFLTYLGLKTGVAAREKTVPDVILRSPKPVVAAFLRALYDCDGYASAAGVTLSTASEEMGKTVQVLLLNFGILASRRANADGTWRVHVTGRSAAVFFAEIGFGLARKQAALAHYIEDRRWFRREDWSDEIVSIERGRAHVYDISVRATHRYAAQGFINHNSYWHSEIMTKKALRDNELIDFADRHSSVVAVHPGRLNPYKLGLELLRDIEFRWNTGRFGKEYEECEDLAAKLNWDKQLGLGRQKLFEIRRLYNDVTFIDEFLTPEFVMRQKLFTFRYNRDTDMYEIASREFKEIKEKLLFRLTNFGQPFIYVEDGNYNNRGELYLRHRYEGVELRMDYARDTLRNIQRIWTRPVHLETVVDEKRRLITFDGRDFSERKMD
ncbi:MAG: SpoVR family protein [Roseiflexus sp.]|nr:SpoVR family protein [Roseiflexus sp.]MCS7288388.1 SpoVR family protein [Roseiflexus sp.]MDW8146537.1 SpoVR family protein [Roseiflexaceae bacterium]MDW8231183.1 SpoVR family protein [Roseiflexaceae bacterium]